MGAKATMHSPKAGLLCHASANTATSRFLLLLTSVDLNRQAMEEVGIEYAEFMAEHETHFHLLELLRFLPLLTRFDAVL